MLEQLKAVMHQVSCMLKGIACQMALVIVNYLYCYCVAQTPVNKIFSQDH